MFAKEPIMIIE